MSNSSLAMTSPNRLYKNTIPKQRTQSVNNILQRMPKDVADSFSDEQLSHLHAALGARSWKKHSIDLRSTFAIPFSRTRIYYVFLVGKNYRELSRSEEKISAITSAILISFFVLISTLFGLLALYLLKSWLGINLFEDFSLGIWGWFKNL
ncbi:3-phosphoshikimate 1-carboxyvinyltransferase [Agaribacter flavus]|uniref:3-phosphoshikimate 1-carboxyvinyltransferase n=1 Tax=Agaribacter flavus TaxID=1902781 RepID=A0ABV7FQH8_9ALTE